MCSLGGNRPVYADRVRHVTDTADEHQSDAWRPANTACQKLFRCIECLRDLEILLETTGRSKNRSKQRRKFKILHTPLHSLVEAIRDLANNLENNPDTVSRLPENARQIVPLIRAQLLQISMADKGGLLATMRDKISAHIDRELSADEMQFLLNQATPAQSGLWLHTCVTVLSDFIKLPVYFWSCELKEGVSIKILFKEPFVVTLGLNQNGEACGLIDVHLIPKPPRRDLVELLMRVVRNSRWMFDKNSPRITSFKEDEPDATWAQSLRWLPQLSGVPAKGKKKSVVPEMISDDGWQLLLPTNTPFFIGRKVQHISKEDLPSI